VVALGAGALLRSPYRTAARVTLAGALAGFGVHHFMYPSFIASLIPAWIPGPLFWAWATGAAFVAASLSALLGRYTRLAGTLLSVMFLCWVVVLHTPRILARPGVELGWTSGFVALAMAGASLLLAEPAA
jgi:uncharacterized membrane protein YphA (DoxX/SURF4 family)